MRRSHRVRDQRSRVGEGVNTPEEFTWLFAREYRSIVRSVDVVLHDHARAEEITQDAFVQLLEGWSRVSTYDRSGCLGTPGRDPARHETCGPGSAGVARSSGSAARPRRPRTPPEVSDRHEEIWAAIRTLPPRQRAVVALYYLDDMPVSEVADIVGCSESSVSVHLHRARRRLADIVGEEVQDRVDR